jgi:hypothetical protein
VIVQGLARARAKWDFSELKVASAVNDAVAALDSLAATAQAPTMESVTKDVNDILTKMDSALSAILHVSATVPSPKVEARTPELLRIEIALLSITAWVFIAVATTAAGAYVLVFSGAATGFDTAVDYLVCLLWGIGLPAGTQLMQATTQSVASTFGVGK